MFDDNSDMIDRQARWWQKGDIHSRELILEQLKPQIAAMARSKWKKSRSGFAESGDYENEALLAILTSIKEWDGKIPFVRYAMGQSRYAMLRVAYSHNPIKLKPSTITVALIHARLKERLGRDPTLQEIHEVDPKYSIELISNALNSVSWPVQLDDEKSAVVDLKLCTFDTYFQDDTPSEPNEAEKDHLSYVLSGVEEESTKHAMALYIEHDGYLPTIAEALGKTVSETNTTIKQMVRRLEKLDVNSPAFLERIRRNRIYDQVRANPDLLNLLSPKGRLYMEAALVDPSMTHVGNKYGVTMGTVRNSLKTSYKKIEEHYFLVENRE